eukprot:6476700-Amphidinium_carterae.1
MAELQRRLEQRGIPKHHTRTNVSLFGPPRSLLLGAVTTRGCGLTKATSQWTEELTWIRKLARTRKVDAEYTSVMLNQTSPEGLPGHQDTHNGHNTLNWILPLGSCEGGELWLEEYEHERTSQSVPLPVALCPPHWDHSRRGRLCASRGQWVSFEPVRFHAVLPILSGVRFSITLFVPAGLQRLDEDTWRILKQQTHCSCLAREHATTARWKQQGQVMLAAEPTLAHELLVNGWCDDDLSDSFMSRQEGKSIRLAYSKLWPTYSLVIYAEPEFLQKIPQAVHDLLWQKLVSQAVLYTTRAPDDMEHDCAVMFLCAEQPAKLSHYMASAQPTWWVSCDASHPRALSTCVCKEQGTCWQVVGSPLHTEHMSSTSSSSLMPWCQQICDAIRITLQVKGCPCEEEQRDYWTAHSWPVTVEEPWDEEPEEAEEVSDARVDNQAEETPDLSEETLTTAEKELVHKVHVNSGHPP